MKFCSSAALAAVITNVVGTVTFWYGGMDFAFLSLDDGRGVRLGLQRGERPDMNERIEATGELTCVEPDIRLENVTVRTLARDVEPPPRTEPRVADLYALTPETAHRYLNRPAALTVHVQDVNRRRAHVQLTVSDLDAHRPTAIATFAYPEDRPLDPDLRRGAVLRLRCVPSALSRDGVIESVVFNMRSAYDVDILSRPPWWTPARILLALAFAALVLLAALGWGAVVTVQVRRARHAARAVAAERKRMAADLHDTIEQHLASAKLLLTCAQKPAGLPDETRSMIRQAENVLIHAKSEVRATVMALRSDDMGQPLAAAIRAIEIPASVRRHLRLAALPERLDPGRQGDLLMIVREAIANALAHGRARSIALAADARADGFVLRILNDGAPFDAATAPGPEAGHFGLAGMRDRAARSGFALSFVTEGRWTGVQLGGAV